MGSVLTVDYVHLHVTNAHLMETISLSNWNVSNVTNFTNMFKNSLNFKQYINSWSVSNSATLTNMFDGATDYNNLYYPTSTVYTTNGTPTSGFFSLGSTLSNTNLRIFVSWWLNSANRLNNPVFINSKYTPYFGNINNWNVSAVTDMSGVFQDTTFNDNISKWNVSNVTDFRNMFKNNTSFNKYVSSWTVSSDASLNDMFSVQ